MKFEICGYENLHRHSDFSIQDGFATVSEYAEYQKSIDQDYLCITDHGTMGAVPQQIAESEKHDLKPIFGIEFYINPMQPETQLRSESADFRKKLSPSEQKVFDKSRHLLGLAYNAEGYRNLVRLSSWAWLHGYYRKPRINYEVLQKYKNGIIFTTTCANSEVAAAFFEGGDEAGFAMIEKYVAMLGGNYYLELMMLDFKQQKPYDAFLLRAHEKYGLPLMLTNDCHYCKKEHSLNQRLMLMQQNKKTLADIQSVIDSGDGEDLFELQDSNLWLKSESEQNLMWENSYKDIIDYELFKEAKRNTVKIARQCEGVELDREFKVPMFPDADAELWDQAMKGFMLRGCPDLPEYHERMQEEYNLIKNKGFSSYFLIEKNCLDEARRKGPEILGFGDGSEVVGPGRGSICGSLVAYCLRLHDVEPIQNDLKFSRFLSPARGGRQMRIRHTIKPVAR